MFCTCAMMWEGGSGFFVQICEIPKGTPLAKIRVFVLPKTRWNLVKLSKIWKNWAKSRKADKLPIWDDMMTWNTVKIGEVPVNPGENLKMKGYENTWPFAKCHTFSLGVV
jgi:hypothetical protein